MRFNEEVITSRNNPLVKWASSLSEKKYRDAEKAFIIEGEKLAFEALEAELPVTHILVDSEKASCLLERINTFADNEKFADTVVVQLSEGAFSKISGEKSLPTVPARRSSSRISRKRSSVPAFSQTIAMALCIKSR